MVRSVGDDFFFLVGFRFEVLFYPGVREEGIFFFKPPSFTFLKKSEAGGGLVSFLVKAEVRLRVGGGGRRRMCRCQVSLFPLGLIARPLQSLVEGGGECGETLSALGISLSARYTPPLTSSAQP